MNPMKTAELKDGLMHIKFDFNSDLLSLVKSFEGRRWISESKTWTAPPVPNSIGLLIKYGFSIGDNLHNLIKKQEAKTPLQPFSFPGLKVAPMPFQIEGVEGIEGFGGRALLADDMGLGKTLQAIAWLCLHPECRPAVVVCPASLKEMWRGKINEWMTGEESIILSGKTPDVKNLFTSSKNPPIYILNYDIIGNKIETIENEVTGKKKRIEHAGTGWVDYLIQMGIKAVVVDECHMIQNAKAARSVGVMKLMSYSKYAIALSGTPVTGRPVQFWPVLSTLAPHLFRNFFNFAKKYCAAKKGYFGWNFNGSSNTTQLNELLKSTVMIRRLKSEVLTELPPKQRSVISLPVSKKEMKGYYQAEKDFSESENGSIAIARMALLKQAATKAKIDSACEWIENFLDSGEKLVLFAHHHLAVDFIVDKFSKRTKIATITGQTKGSRKEQENIFQNDPECRLFIGSKSAMEGLTLTTASNVAFLEFWEVPAWCQQAEDRVHRIGQESESINIWYLVAAGTIEEEQAAILDRKISVLAAVLDGREVDESELISELLEIAKKKNCK